MSLKQLNGFQLKLSLSLTSVKTGMMDQFFRKDFYGSFTCKNFFTVSRRLCQTQRRGFIYILPSLKDRKRFIIKSVKHKTRLVFVLHKKVIYKIYYGFYYIFFYSNAYALATILNLLVRKCLQRRDRDKEKKERVRVECVQTRIRMYQNVFILVYVTCKIIRRRNL